MSSSGTVSISSFNLLFFTHVLTVLTTTIKYNEYVTDKGKNISIPCDSDDSIMWVKEENNNHNNNNTFKIIQTGAILVLSNITETDAGIYICIKREIHNELMDLNATTTTTTTTTETTETTDTTPTTIAHSYSNDTNRMNTILADANNHTHHNYHEYLKAKLIVRTTPGPVTQLYFKASTILGFLIWRYNKSNSGGYPLRSFTAEYRFLPPDDGNVSDVWIQLDPPNIAPNVRQMEVYKLTTNSTYEFRIWANNKLGSGVIVTTNVTTLPDTKEEDLVRLIKDDIENFDVRVWIAAVGVVLGSLIILAIGVCVLMAIECYQSSTFARGYEDGWDSIELIPNIILNPGFCDSDGVETPYTRTIIFGEDDDSDGYDTDSVSSMEKPMDVFKRKVSIFFTGQTIRRM